MRWITGLAVAAVMVAPGSAWAGYTNNRTQWEDMPEAAQAGYVRGAFDALDIQFEDEAPSDKAIRAGRARCVLDLKISTGTLVKIVNEGYQADISTYRLSPTWMMVNQLAKVCRSYISEERVRLGLSPLPSR